MENVTAKKKFIISGLEFLYLIFTLLPILIWLLFFSIAVEHIIEFGRIINYGVPVTDPAERRRFDILFRLYDILILSYLIWVPLTLLLVLPGWLTISRKLAITGLFTLTISLIIGWFDPFGIWKYISD